MELNYVVRINLKTGRCKDRKELIDYCLYADKKYLAIGWSGVYQDNQDIDSYEKYYYAVKNDPKTKRMNPAHNIFWNTQENDIFWTRDMDGFYWICRATDKARSKCDCDMDIGAVIPVEAYKVGLEVPGQIKASFNRPLGGTCEKIYDGVIVEYSKKMFNQLSGQKTYEVSKIEGYFLDNLPDLELEELVISYLQLKENYYVLSNSIAKKSTTVKIECELISRDINELKKAVVQVKGGKNKDIDAMEYKQYDDDGYLVYLYAPSIKNIDCLKYGKIITNDDLYEFYNKYKTILPESITKWENL